jgi:hypothetical protein
MVSLASSDFRVLCPIIQYLAQSLKHALSQVRGDGLTQLYELMARLGDRVGSKLVKCIAQPPSEFVDAVLL